MMCLVAMAPMSLFQYYGTSQFCTPENQSSRLYCRNTFFPSLYGHVQTFYWYVSALLFSFYLICFYSDFYCKGIKASSITTKASKYPTSSSRAPWSFCLFLESTRTSTTESSIFNASTNPRRRNSNLQKPNPQQNQPTI